MADLVVIVPSRDRPKAAHELHRAFVDTCTAPVRLIFAIDDRDQGRIYEYPHLHEGNVDTITWRTPSTNMVQALNAAAEDALNDPYLLRHEKPPYALGFMGDDHRPRTVGWDQRYLDALREMGTGVVYGNDLFQGHRLPTQVAMTSDIVRAVGYMAPPALRHLFVDNTWLRWGKSLDRIRYLPDVIVEHRHPHAGKAQWDEGYLRVNSGEVASHDEAVFNAYVADGLDADLAKIRAVMAVAA
jgi:hypothetical protein